MVRYIIRRLLWVVVLLFAGQPHHLRHLLHPALGRPGAAARRPPAEPGAGRADPPQPRARQPLVPAVLRLHEATWSCTSTSATATRTTSSVKEQIFDRLPAIDLAGDRRRGDLARAPASRSGSSRRSGAARCSTASTMGAALVAISAPVYWLGLVALYLFSDDIGKFPPSSRARAATCRSREDPSHLVPVAAPALVRAGGGVRRPLRAPAAREPDRGDVRGLHPHGAGQGPARAARGLAPRRCAARSRRS